MRGFSRAQARVSPQAAARRLEEAGQVARASLGEARRAIWALRPEALEHGSLGRALAGLATEFSAQTGIDTQAAVTGGEHELAPEAQEALLRVAQAEPVWTTYSKGSIKRSCHVG